MNREEIIKLIDEKKIVVVTRGIYDEELEKLAKALFAGGIRLFEMTYDPTDPDTNDIVKRNIESLTKKFNGELILELGQY